MKNASNVSICIQLERQDGERDDGVRERDSS